LDQQVELTSLNHLKNKVAVVTGAADGIGLAISQVFAEQGATVVMADINQEKVAFESAAICQQGKAAEGISCDVGDTAQVNALIKQTISTHQRIDILVNNAAVALSGNILEMPEEDWDKVFNINLKSVFRTTQACLPHMIKQQNGCVINLSSIQAFRSWRDWTAYAAAKGAIVSMTNQLAGQFGHHNIRFNTLSPGAILTPMNEFRIEQEGNEFLQKSINMSPAKRIGQAIEVANTAAFLASNQATFINGTDIKIDGGLCTLPHYDEDE